MFAVCDLRKGMINIDSFIKAKQFKSMHKILNSKNDNWNSLGKWWYDQIFNTEYFLTTCSNFNGFQINKLPIYYQHLLKSWSNFLLLQKPMTKLEVLVQPMATQILFSIASLFFPKFYTVIHKVRDICDCETNNVKD